MPPTRAEPADHATRPAVNVDAAFFVRHQELRQATASLGQLDVGLRRVHAAAEEYIQAVAHVADIYAVLAFTDRHHRPSTAEVAGQLQEDLRRLQCDERLAAFKSHLQTQVLEKTNLIRPRLRAAEASAASCMKPLKHYVKCREKVHKIHRHMALKAAKKAQHRSGSRKSLESSGSSPCYSTANSLPYGATWPAETDAKPSKRCLKHRRALEESEAELQAAAGEFHRDFEVAARGAGFAATRQLDTFLQLSVQLMKELSGALQQSWERFPGGQKAAEERREQENAEQRARMCHWVAPTGPSVEEAMRAHRKLVFAEVVTATQPSPLIDAHDVVHRRWGGAVGHDSVLGVVEGGRHDVYPVGADGSHPGGPTASSLLTLADVEGRGCSQGIPLEITLPRP